MYEVKIYKDKNGKSEIKEYLQHLAERQIKDNRIRFNKISAYIELLSKNGLKLNEIYIKKIDKELWELRPIRDRIIFAVDNNKEFVLLSIFMKQTRKTPRSEIEKARRFLEDYKKRSG